nr:GGDEF domain-containing protein [Acidovorax sp. ACV02]
MLGNQHINDTHSHAVGDQVLVEFARRLRDAVRVTDTVARLAGDEFVVSLESPVDEAAAAQVARKIVGLVGEAPFVFQELRLAITTSVGVAFHATSDAFEPDLGEQLMQRADTALYRAKAAGRNSFVLVANKDGET